MSPFVVGPGTFNPRGKIVVFSKSDSEARTQPETDPPGHGLTSALLPPWFTGRLPGAPAVCRGGVGHWAVDWNGGGSLLIGTGCWDSCHWRSYSTVVSLTLTCMRPLPS